MKRSRLGTLALGLGGLMAHGAARAAEVNLTPTNAPASLDATPASGEAPKKSAGAGVGINPNTPQITGGTKISAKDAEALTATTASAGADEWKFDFHGYMRAPMRLSWGPPSPIEQPPNSGGAATGLVPNQAPSGTQLHQWPRVPGGSYITWEYTNTVPGPWAQLNFSYGNSRAMMTIIVDSYSQTSAGYRNLQAQQGIDQAFLTVNFPEVFGDYGGLVWNIGSFQNRYGAAGKYDGGMYETHLFGKTRVAGETLSANFSFGDWGLTLEKGIGAKIEAVPFTNNQPFQIYKGQAGANCYGLTGFGQKCPDNQGFGFQNYLSDRDAEYLPYPGTVPQGSTFLAHGHAGLSYKKMWTFGAHFLYTWTPDDNWTGLKGVEPGTSDATMLGNSQLKNVSNMVPRVLGPTKGSLMIYGGEVRLNGGVYGDGYVGLAQVRANNINALSDSLEFMHSWGGWQFKQNYFGRTFDPHTGQYTGPQNESGTVTALSWQYAFSFGALANYPNSFWGQGPDLVATIFGNLTFVDSPAPVVNGQVQGEDTSNPTTSANNWNIKTKKLKFGADVAYTPLPWFGMGLRYDNVQPDLDAVFEGSHQNFQVFSPRIVFKTAFLTHEAITINYQRFILGSAAYAGYPYEWVAKADENLFAIAATMWW